MQDQVAEPLEKRLQELKWYDRTETYTRPGMAFITLSLQDRRRHPRCRKSSIRRGKSLGMKQNLRGRLGPMIEILRRHLCPLCAESERRTGGCWYVMPKPCASSSCTFPGEESEYYRRTGRTDLYLLLHDRLATMGLSPQDIFNALNSQNALTAAGSIETRGAQIFIRLDGAFDELQKIRDTPLLLRAKRSSCPMWQRLNEVMKIPHFADS
jgi:hypothetical protein